MDTFLANHPFVVGFMWGPLLWGPTAYALGTLRGCR